MDSDPPDLATARLVMPYACTVENGALTVRPSPDRVFEIVGEREQRLFTTCDPPFSNNCRSLTVYRFEVACGTSRVSWPSVVTAIGRTTAGEASMSKGHMVLARAGTPTSGHAPSCSDRKAVDGGAAGECLPWRMKKPIEKLVLPQGFAPLREVGGRLVDEYAPAMVGSAGGVMALGAALAGADLAAAGPHHQADAVFDSPDATGAAAAMQVASRSEEVPGQTGGWSTSLSIYRGEEPPPELIVTAAVPSPAFGRAPASATAAALYLPAWLPWIGVLGCVGLAGAYLCRVDRVRTAAPTLADVTAGAWRGVEAAQRFARLAGGELRGRLAATAPAPADAGELDDPGLASALLQLQAMLARTEAAVSMLSTAVVLREVMQTDLAAIKARLAEAESAARSGSVPMMKFTAQLRQIARDIDRVQHITESASRSFGQHAGAERGLPTGLGGRPSASTGRG